MKNKFPFSKQEGLKDCGAASLQMIIKYYNGYISIEELNELLQTNRDGTTAYNLIEVAKKIGFEAYGIKIPLSEMKSNNLIFPLIVHTTIDKKYNHFMVVYKIDSKRKKIVLADPQTKIKKISFSEFEKIYNGVSMIFYPLKPIIRKNNISINQMFLEILKKYKQEFKYLIIMSIALIIFSISTTFYMKILFDNIDLSDKLISIIFTMFLILNIFKILANFFRNQILIILNKKISFELNLEAFKKVINLPYHYYQNKTTGEILSKLVELEKLQDAISKLILVLLIDVPLALVSIIVLMCINYRLFFVSLIFIVFYFLILLIYKQIINKKTEESLIEKSNYISYLKESISGFETIKNLGIESKILDKLEIKYIKYLKNINNLNEIINFQLSIKELVGVVLELTLVYLGILFVKNGQITIGNLLAFNSMQIFFFTPIRNIIDLDVCLIEAKKIIKKVFEMFENNIKNNIRINKINKIQLKKLNYNYKNCRALKNINLSIKKGEKIIIIGNSGSGKSTFLKSLMGYLNVKRNMINYDEVDINDIDNLKKHITYISQKESLFTDSLINNVKIFDNSEFNIVTKMFFLDEIVKNNILGYNMLIEEDGFNISGGQKQRIALARACMKNFDILLVDEGMNQIDISLERKILKNMFDYYKEKTIIIVSHRKDNMDLYDRVLEFRNGRIVKDIYKNEKYRCL